MSSIATKPVEIEQALRNCAGQWKGCDWFTTFGKTRLNLRSVRASHAVLMARATAGEEKADWLAAVDWLTEVEHDANEAEHEARQGVHHLQAGRLSEALQHALRACEIEKRYHPCPIWIVFKEAVEAGNAATGRLSCSPPPFLD